MARGGVRGVVVEGAGRRLTDDAEGNHAGGRRAVPVPPTGKLPRAHRRGLPDRLEYRVPHRPDVLPVGPGPPVEWGKPPRDVGPPLPGPEPDLLDRGRAPPDWGRDLGGRDRPRADRAPPRGSARAYRRFRARCGVPRRLYREIGRAAR